MTMDVVVVKLSWMGYVYGVMGETGRRVQLGWGHDDVVQLYFDYTLNDDYCC